ncbi:methionine-R-sulfoxide reductase B1 isoform X2 [Chlorocebus sabaeus]|uniref:methionine-R-sulfoxide reductase B1 isoform X2 n=1 Tax=Chlorocebus sabaeus TaxID=60711 RepID=UPI0018B067D8|nr:methionine-R-sulfoxide reductase B1 isoform X2 [Chlorocebus sabaeus]
MSFCSFFGGEVFQNHFEPGIYVCAKCGYELFSSRSKYAHSSPWPAFTETIHADSVAKRVLWQVWQWVGPRVPERWPQARAVPILNIQQLAEVCP